MHVARELVPRYARLQCAVKRLQRSKTIFNVDGWAAGVVVEVRVRVYRGVVWGTFARGLIYRLSWRCAEVAQLCARSKAL